MRNLYLDLEANQSSTKNELADALMELQETDPELFRETEDILLNAERKMVYDAIDTQYHAYAHILDSLDNQDSAQSSSGENKHIFNDSHQWSKRLVEF